MRDDLIRRSDAIKAVSKVDDYGDGIGFEVRSHCLVELELVPSADRPQGVIAQVTFDEEKLREIVKEAVERFKEEYEIVDRPQGEWIIHFDDLFPEESSMECSVCHEEQPLGIDDNFCPNCGASMKGADDDL